MEELISLISNVGFPIAVTAFLLIRIEKQLDQINRMLINMVELLSKND
ncbi:YvrJ family protein [Lutispora saccharofermentans]|uniref:YvrJ family protein n=1 Tax=Lutispora saccharofermentans TaxID=3024236 RepID=A0ABT1NHK8_9FIRM|nr:YvrJ family protein [Lutispora saccharofermentans]